MLIQLQPIQISLMWHEIKDSVLKTHQIPENKHASYSTRLLKNLLTGKYQCWIIYALDDDKQKRTHAIGVTSIGENSMLGIRTLHVLSLYGYRLLTDKIAVDAFRKLREYATSNRCERIKLETNVKRIRVLAKKVGFECDSTSYSMHL